ncbi:GIY-YIG nuclease family protein [Variovorax sp. ZS18.2.2]|uniref:GIY-YIG nuclease family protein n=1 Tax=Variovorax sp. ZS18.2.2 TaxID=2971255 RepID=UPI0035B09B97
MPSCVVYLLACDGGRTYTGISANPQRRYQLHKAGKASMFTRLNPPTALLAEVWLEDRRSAAIVEHLLKRQSQARRVAWFQRMNPSTDRCPHSLSTALDLLSRCDSKN